MCVGHTVRGRRSSYLGMCVGHTVRGRQSSYLGMCVGHTVRADGVHTLVCAWVAEFTGIFIFYTALKVRIHTAQSNAWKYGEKNRFSPERAN
ncbi:MAG: hypothetical protein GY749_35575 [Desulfobacteraceae bacterium]|nr:hypothetical protein [Desulfobacteraceae bacterium]